MTTLAPARAATGVGPMLRQWRERRRLSQLDLAIRADVSARHLSFVETGRSRPSSDMIIRLAEHLDVPIRERNVLLIAGGYAPAYPETPLDDPAMAPLREVIDQLLRGYEPYPALVFDAGYDVVAANEAVSLMLTGVSEDLLAAPMNVMRLALHPDGLAPRISNLGEVRAHLLDRVRRHLDIWQSDQLRDLYEELTAYPGPDGDDGPGATATVAPGTTFALPLRLRTGGPELSFISAVATFNTPLDVTVSELGIETFLPADPPTAAYLHGRSRG